MRVKYTAYRDSKTGRFVKRSTWKRSKAQGGKRYKRAVISYTRQPTKPKPPTVQFPPGEQIEAGGGEGGAGGGGGIKHEEEEEEEEQEYAEEFDEGFDINPDDDGEYPEV